MSFAEASQSIRRSAQLGHRARRRVIARQFVARWLPWAAAAACLASAIALLVGRARPLGLVLMAASGIAAAVVLIAARRDGTASGADVAAVDRAAGLGDALRSAHWFVTQPHGREPDDQWITFHVETAADRADVVDWAAVYPSPRAARRWLATIALGTAAAALLTLESPRWPPPSASAPEQHADTLIVIPPHLAGEVVDGMNSLKAGTRPPERTMRAVGQALEIARKDPRARRELEELFARSRNAAARFLDAPWLGDHDWDVNEMPYWDDATPALEWAYDDAVARAALQESPERAAAAPSRSSRQTGDGRRGALERGRPGAGQSDSVPVRADTRGQPGSFASLLFGRQQAQDDDAEGAGRRAAVPNAGLTAALRREVVHARSDVPEVYHPAAARRRPDPQPPPPAAGIASTGLAYDASHTSQPPAVPEARRALLHDVFARPREPEPAPAQP